MSSRRLPALLALFAFAPALLRAERLRVASYNLENYNLADRMTTEGFAKNAPKPEKSKAALRGVIRSLNADVLAVQEIGGPAFVEELRRDLASEGLAYPHTVTLEGPDPHRRLALFSKRPFLKTRIMPRIKTGFAIPSPGEREALVNRGLLGVEIAAGGDTLRLHTVHLKSRLTRDKRDPRGEGERRAEAESVAQLLGAEHAPAGRALLVGDFNDGPNSATLGVFTRVGLLRLEATDARGEAWTYRNDKKGIFDRSDYAFVSPALKPAVVRARAWDHPWTAQASDHRPVVIDFEFPENTPTGR